jgi:hypothetical protein
MSDMQQPGTEPARNPKAEAKAAAAYAKATRPWYNKKRWWAVGALLLIIIVGAGSGGADTEPAAADSTQSADAAKDEASEEPTKKTEPTKEAEPTKKAAPKPAPKAIKVEAKKILKQFEENEAAADLKYKGKVIQVSGQIDKVDTEIWDDDQYVVRVGSGGQWEFLTVNCNDLPASAVTSLKKGQDVTVRGEFDDGGDLGVEIKDCKVL